MSKAADELHTYEAKVLAPYAQFSAKSQGRRHEESFHPPRPNFQRDRDRILHSRALRRLEFKTHLFLGHETRSRLTYATQASGLARTIARHLALNEDLAEAITLARALGYPPFGETGRTTLTTLMKPHGGYDPLVQSHRILTETETRYPEFNGLNLCHEVNEAVLAPTSLEAQVAVQSERLTQVCYGLEDGLEADFFSEAELQTLPLWSDVEKQTRHRYPRLEAERCRYFVLRCLILDLIEDVVATSRHQLHESSIICSSPTRHEQLKATEKFLQQHLVEHPSLQATQQKAAHLLQELFQTIASHPHLLNPPFCHRLKKDGAYRATCDYLVWMTDRYAQQQFDQYVGPTELAATPLRQSPLL